MIRALHHLLEFEKATSYLAEIVQKHSDLVEYLDNLHVWGRELIRIWSDLILDLNEGREIPKSKFEEFSDVLTELKIVMPDLQSVVDVESGKKRDNVFGFLDYLNVAVPAVGALQHLLYPNK
jgi:hypothetical protein